METAIRGKAKRRHLSACECALLGRSDQSPLSQPSFTTTGRPNPNRGLFPRTPPKRHKRDSDVDGSIHQKPITKFFPVTSILRTSPQKAPSAAVKMEGSPHSGVTPKDEEDIHYLLEGLTDSMFMDDDEFAPSFSVKEEEFARPVSVKEGEFARPVSVKEEEFARPVSVKVEQEWTAGCSSWASQRPLGTSGVEPPGAVRVKLEEDEDEEYSVEPLPDAHYGLLGSSEGQVLPQGHLGDLPDEILLVVFGHLPAEDLYRHISLVCRRWRAIISDPQFVPWKKLYYQYQKGEEEAVRQVTSILTDNHISDKEDLCVLNMVKYMSRFKHSRRVQPEQVLRCVSAHRLFPQAAACIRSRIPDLQGTQGDPNPWSAMALMLVLADGVKDVLDLVTRLKRSGCLLSPGGVSEYLCCVALLLLAMRKNSINISSRVHYNIFYVLHLMENSPPPTRVPQSGLNHRVDFQVTHEQQQILNHDIQPGHMVKIMAFAGTGKTSTLVRYAQQRPHLRFLYVAFNKSTAEEAQHRFPENAVCKTVHSMAFKALGWRYQRMKKLFSNVKPFSVAWVLPQGRGGFVNAKVVTQTINAFFASADQRISIDHVPREFKNTNGQFKRPSHQEMMMFVKDAQNIWDKMMELRPTKQAGYNMTHDGYLKLWQMQKPRLENYDVIFIDEAQDCTPAVMDILLSQECGKVLVGDPHQQIYTFRGAINALQAVPHTHLYYLTQSFRFGPEIAYVGATVLDVCKKVEKILVGGSQEGSVTGHGVGEYVDALLGSGCVRGRGGEGTVAFLSRCNVTVFDQAVRLTEGNGPPRIHIVGGSDNFGLKKILDIWVLMQPENERKQKNLVIEDKFISSFCRQKQGGYAGLKVYIKHTEDRELEAKLAVVEKYNHRIPELIERLYNCSVSSPHSADFILGTVHKSKGLEFDTVVITDDFIKIPCARHNLQRLTRCVTSNIPEDEWNLLYVAVTRAKKTLIITKTIQNILTLAGEYFLRSELTSTLVRDGQPPCCSIKDCQNRIREDTALSMHKIPIKYIEGADSGGPLCLTCVEQRMGHVAYLMAPAEEVKAMPYTEEEVELPVNIGMLVALL
ncbi:F-box DNA helicase 1 [Megalops cyprinoides]|uniref:F-box DNA helicase 1 n=1 Tax=Megalops cyprinoides TaxID=118141 RepID=UPI00186407AB|nr:F-box DNA helicase 1 [Megalops cyprinoides]